MRRSLNAGETFSVKTEQRALPARQAYLMRPSCSMCSISSRLLPRVSGT